MDWLEGWINGLSGIMVAALGINSEVASIIAVSLVGIALAVPPCLIAYGIMRFFEAAGDATRSIGENGSEAVKIGVANSSEGFKNLLSWPTEAVKAVGLIFSAYLNGKTQKATITATGNTGRQISVNFQGEGAFDAITEVSRNVPAIGKEVYGTDLNRPLLAAATINHDEDNSHA